MNMRIHLYIILISLSVIVIAGCSTRLESPVINNAEGIISYSPKDTTGIKAEVILYKGIDETTGNPLTAKSFTIGKKAKLYGTVKLLNRNYHQGEDLMIHIDWLDPEGNSFFKKRIDIPSSDTTAELKSAISIQPENRDTGNYLFRVYLFRELIVEKNFSLVLYDVDSANVFSKTASERILADISLGRKFDKKKDIPADTGSTFTMKGKSKVYAGIRLLNKELYQGRTLELNVNWYDSNDSSLFSKRMSLSPYDESTYVKSSISINEKSRPAGKYKVKVYLYGNLIGEKSFSLVKDDGEIKLTAIKGLESNIVLCRRIDKKSNQPVGVSDEFTIKDGAKIYSVITIKDSRKKTPDKSFIKVEWLGPGNKPFYDKKFKFSPENGVYRLSSSISIFPGKRKPGEYKCRVYYNLSLIGESKFKLVPPGV
jgi:hypothetical protein